MAFALPAAEWTSLEFAFCRLFRRLGPRRSRADKRQRNGAANELGAFIRRSFRHGQRCEKFFWAATLYREGRKREAILLGRAAFKVGPIGWDVLISKRRDNFYS
jgi:hypothetical protein